MLETYPIILPEDVFLFYIKRELTDEEVAKGIIINKYGNANTGTVFLDSFAGLVRRLGWKEQTVYADVLGVPTKDLGATIRTLTGKSVKDWLDFYVKIGTRELMAKTNKKITEIALELGFSDQASYSHYCSERFKAAPSDLRRRLRLKR